MEKNLILTLQQAKNLYPKASMEFKELLELSFGKTAFNIDITEKINTIDDVYEYVLSNNGKLYDEYWSIITRVKTNTKLLACIQLQMIEFCLNEGEIPKLGEKKWYPYFFVEKAGLVFDFSHWCVVHSHGTVACFKNEKLSNFAGKKFTKIYENFVG